MRKSCLILFVILLGVVLPACKKVLGNDFKDFPNGKYTCEFISDSFPNENYTQEFIGVKGYLTCKKCFSKEYQMILTSNHGLDSLTQEKIVLDYKRADFYKAFGNTVHSIGYNITISSNKIIGRLAYSYSGNVPDSFILTYTP